jgi:hypothetical protein
MAPVELRLRNTHPDYGPNCPGCAGPKALQASECYGCFRESRRDEVYWAHRTCPFCGGPKCDHSVKCFDCDSERKRGLSLLSEVGA